MNFLEFQVPYVACSWDWFQNILILRTKKNKKKTHKFVSYSYAIENRTIHISSIGCTFTYMKISHKNINENVGVWHWIEFGIWYWACSSIETKNSTNHNVKMMWKLFVFPFCIQIQYGFLSLDFTKLIRLIDWIAKTNWLHTFSWISQWSVSAYFGFLLRKILISLANNVLNEMRLNDKINKRMRQELRREKYTWYYIHDKHFHHNSWESVLETLSN